MTEEREMTALDAPIGAGAEQSSELTPIYYTRLRGGFQPLSRGNVRGADAV